MYMHNAYLTTDVETYANAYPYLYTCINILAYRMKWLCLCPQFLMNNFSGTIASCSQTTLCDDKDKEPSSCIQAWDWHCQSANSGGVLSILLKICCKPVLLDVIDLLSVCKDNS